MRLVGYRQVEAGSSEIRTGVLLRSDICVDLADASGGELPSHPANLLAMDDWPRPAANVPISAANRIEPFILAAPQPVPGKIIAVGLNYANHAEESGAEIPAGPILFAKWPSAIIGPDEPILFPANELDDDFDYEIELSVIIGQKCSRVEAANALDYVGGYTIANDISARKAQFRDGQWTYGKSFDPFCPLGPWIVTADEISNPSNLELRFRVNGETRQKANTREMIFRWLVSSVTLANTCLSG